MKWFKHDTDAFTSEGIEALIDKFGFAGYGRWNRLLEIIAFKMDETDRCSVEYPVSKWCSLLGLKQKKLILFLKLTENELKTKVFSFENKIRIEIPNLLKKRDKYTKDLQKKGQQLTPKNKIEEVDIDKEKNIVVFDFEDLWQRYPNKDGKKSAEKHFRATVKTEKDFGDINKALDNYLVHLKKEDWKKPKNGSTWFNNWKDWVNWKDEGNVLNIDLCPDCNKPTNGIYFGTQKRCGVCHDKRTA